ncbi:MAG: hypothetical protein PHF74_04335 [Dehalococcoidales bacterium]|nr:hypothetical protein [Dehalococcoidales bacterium]
MKVCIIDDTAFLLEMNNDCYIQLFRNSNKSNGKLHIETTPSVECLAATYIKNRKYLDILVSVDIKETIASQYSRLYTQLAGENIVWNYDEICGTCKKTLLKNIKLGLWPYKEK